MKIDIFNFISRIIELTIGPAIGGICGGVAAYMVAEMKFSSDNIKEGNVGLFAMQIELETLERASTKVINILNKQPENEVDAKNFLNHFSQKDEVGFLLLNEMDIFKNYCNRYYHQILRCALPPVTSDREKRHKYKGIHEDIRLLIRKIRQYQETYSKLSYGIERKKGVEEYTKESITRVLDHNYLRRVSNASKDLSVICDSCKEISKKIEEIGYSKKLGNKISNLEKSR